MAHRARAAVQPGSGRPRQGRAGAVHVLGGRGELPRIGPAWGVVSCMGGLGLVDHVHTEGGWGAVHSVGGVCRCGPADAVRSGRMEGRKTLQRAGVGSSVSRRSRSAPLARLPRSLSRHRQAGPSGDLDYRVFSAGLDNTVRVAQLHVCMCMCVCGFGQETKTPAPPSRASTLTSSPRQRVWLTCPGAPPLSLLTRACVCNPDLRSGCGTRTTWRASECWRRGEARCRQ